ncbi:MAG: hypothetical protein ACREJO_09675 [Phycisphaerales bacterium]
MFTLPLHRPSRLSTNLSRASLAITLAAVVLCAAGWNAQASTQPERRNDTTAVRGGWTIVLAAFRGDDQGQLAEQTLGLLNSTGQASGARAIKRGPATLVVIGSYTDPADKSAQAELQRIRDVEVKGEKPFAGAFLSPPEGGGPAGSRPEYNLMRAKEQYRKARFSLQVAVYGPTDRKPTPEEQAESRKAAETAAATLRHEGELAFYYHGPSLSMVTIGVFNDDDVARRGDARNGIAPKPDSPVLSAVKRRFPHNLVNGAAVKTTQTIGNKKIESIQESQLVEIPGK